MVQTCDPLNTSLKMGSLTKRETEKTELLARGQWTGIKYGLARPRGILTSPCPVIAWILFFVHLGLTCGAVGVVFFGPLAGVRRRWLAESN